MGFLSALPGAIALGLIWGLMAIGVYITYKVLDFAGIEAYQDKSKEEIKEIITKKAKHYIHKDSIDFWMKNPNPIDIKDGNDLPDFEISRRVMLEEKS